MMLAASIHFYLLFEIDILICKYYIINETLTVLSLKVMELVEEIEFIFMRFVEICSICTISFLFGRNFKITKHRK